MSNENPFPLLGAIPEHVLGGRTMEDKLTRAERLRLEALRATLDSYKSAVYADLTTLFRDAERIEMWLRAAPPLSGVSPAPPPKDVGGIGR